MEEDKSRFYLYDFEKIRLDGGNEPTNTGKEISVKPLFIIIK